MLRCPVENRIESYEIDMICCFQGFGSGVNFEDGAWHQVTITTNPGGQPGYNLYIDGHLAGKVTANSTDVLGHPVQASRYPA